MTDSDEIIVTRRFPAGLVLTITAVILGALLAFHGLDNYPFWEDEAQTAILARNLNTFGTLTGWDGANLVGWEQGAEFDENLEYVKIPPQHFYIAAAGFRLFGETTFGGRAPFVLVGLLTIGALAWWTRRFLGAEFPWWLPAAILAVTPAYLLLIRNCRYFSPGIFWTIVLLAAWTVAAETPALSPPALSPRWRVFLRHTVAALAVVGVFTTHYLYAAAALGMLPVFVLCDPRYRSRSQWALLATVYGAGLICGLWAIQRGEGLFTREETVPWLKNAAVLFWWQIRDTGGHEYFAWPMLLPLALPWIVPRLAASRPLAAKGLLLTLAFVANLTVVAVISQQPIDNTDVASVRYFAPLLAVGALTSGISLKILWRLNRFLALAVALLLVLTNLLHLGPKSGPFPRTVKPFPIRSRLWDYVRENASPHRSSYAILIEQVALLAPGTRLRVVPLPACYPLMFYTPHVHQCDQLSPGKKIRDDLRPQLPDYLFTDFSTPDILMVHPVDGRISPDAKTVSMARPHLEAGRIYFRRVGFTRMPWRDTTRPDIPGHLFQPHPASLFKPGFAIFERYEPEIPPPIIGK